MVIVVTALSLVALAAALFAPLWLVPFLAPTYYLALLVLNHSMIGRRARPSCVCCGGYPVCWVEGDGWPEERLCPRHALRWEHIRDMERELLNGA